MDCERFDAVAIEFACGELPADDADEAAAHLLGCTRCTALIQRLHEGQRAANELTLQEVPSGLEERIVAAAAKHSRPAPLRRRTLFALAAVGAYAMRPQVAMAAVVVLMIGMSAILLRRGDPLRRARVTDEGTPVATPMAADPASTTAAEHRLQEGTGAPALLQAPTTASGASSAMSGAGAEKRGTRSADEEPAPTKDDSDKLEAKAKSPSAESIAAPPAQVPLEPPKKSSEGAPPPAAPAPVVGAGPGSPNHGTTDVARAAGARARSGGDKGGGEAASEKDAERANATSYDDAMKSFSGKQFALAAKGFDAIAASGTRVSSSLLHAGRSYRALGNCGQAIVRFQRVTTEFAGTADAANAAVEGGECAQAIGNIALAKTMFGQARSFAPTRARAERGLRSVEGNSSDAADSAKATGH